MIRATTGHPVRALRGAGVLLAIWIACRVPAMQAAFEAAVAGAGASRIVAPTTAMRRAAAALSAAPIARPVVVAQARRRRSRPTLRTLAPALARVDLSTPAIAVAFSQPAIALPASPADAIPAAPSTAAGLVTAGDYAAQAYARLAIGDRRAAVRLLDAALAGTTDVRAAAWQGQRDALTRRWSGSAYSIVRASGAADLAVTPVLGGGQSGAALAWSPDPLAPRPLALTARATAAHDDGGRSALAAVGLAWHPVAGVTLAVERLIAVGPAARGDWTARVAGGGARSRGVADAAAYGEAGVVGTAVYAAGQVRLGVSAQRGRFAVGPGVGAWASVQYADGATVDRLDLGPGITARAGRLRLSADYRVRVAGNAAPGSGPVVTLAAAF